MFNETKYTKWYYRIIVAAKPRKKSKELYTEHHHIIPDSMGGPTTKQNMVHLTAREHFICHWLLTKMTSGAEYHSIIASPASRNSNENKTSNSLGECIMKRTGKTLKLLAGVSLLLGVLGAPATAQEKPKELKIGITTFLSGPAAVFGEPGKAAAEMIAADINKNGGIGGAAVALSFVCERAGGEASVSHRPVLVP